MASNRKHTTFTTSTAAIAFGCALAASSAATAQAPTPPAEQPTAETPAAETPAAEAPAAVPAPGPAALAPTPPPPEPPQSLIADGQVPKGPIAPASAPAIPNIDYGARMRVGMKVQNPNTPDKLNDIGEQLDTDLLFSGQIHRYFKWTASLTLSYGGTAGASNNVNVQPLDVFAHIPVLPELNLMLGRMLVIADRFAPGGPWGMDEYFFAGFFPSGAPAVGKAGPGGRDVGATVWGAPFGGHAKYYLGVFNLADPASHPLYSGRVQVSLLGAEPAFNQRTTYYGTKDLISVGVGGQYQQDGSTRTDSSTTPPTVLTDTFKYVTADLTVEKTIEGAGTVSAVGAFNKFWGDYQPWKQSYLASFGYMLPQVVGIGKPRVTLRYQAGKSPAPGAKTSYVADAQLSYPVHAWFVRPMVGYRHGDMWSAASGSSQASNMVYFALQLWDP